MKYRATEQGFIDRFINVGDIVEWDGPPPISGLVALDDPQPEPVVDRPKRSRAVKAGPVADEDADII